MIENDPISEQLRRLISQNQEMERKLRDLQLALAGVRADFETVVAARLQQLEPSESEATLVR